MSGDEDQFELFVRATESGLRGAAYKLCSDWHQAEDLTQLTYVKIFQRWGQIEDRHRMRNYAYRVLFRSFVSDRRRSRWRYEALQREALQWEAVEAAVVAAVPVEDRIVIEEALGRLGDHQRQVIVLRYFADLSVRETAAVLGCSPGTVRSQASRALQTLRSVLNLTYGRRRES